MMRPYPFFGFPTFRRLYPYHAPYQPFHNINSNSVQYKGKALFPSVLPEQEQKKLNDGFSNASTNTTSFIQQTQNIENNTEEFFEIFGLKLYFDDLLIIALLFFLYQEEVKDTYLYIALVLLLLS